MTLATAFDEYARTTSLNVTATPRPVSLVPARPEDDDRPDIPLPIYLARQPLWEKCRIVFDGTEAVRAAGTVILNRMPYETDDEYANRSTLVALDNWSKRALKASTGLLLEKDVTFSEDMPAELGALAEDFDGKGNHMAVVVQELVESKISDGYAGLLCDAPRANLDRMTLADATRIGLRPYSVVIKRDQVIKIADERVNNRTVPTLLVIYEIAPVRRGRFGIGTVERFRIYTRNGDTVSVEVWEKDPAQPNMAPTLMEKPIVLRGLTEIPFSPFGDYEGLPDLLDLVNLNIEHHQTKSGMANIQQECFCPLIVRIGAQADPETKEYPPLRRGTRTVVEAPLEANMPQKPVYYAQPDPTVLEPARADLEALERAMGAAAGAFMGGTEKRVGESAEKKRLDRTSDKATLASNARLLQDCLELDAMHRAAFIGGGMKAGSIVVNRDFEAALMEPAAMMAYVALVKLGYPKLLAVQALKAGGRIPPDADDGEVVMQWEGEAEAELARQEQAAREIAEDRLPQAGAVNTDDEDAS